jgi:HEAT repeat protein
VAGAATTDLGMVPAAEAANFFLDRAVEEPGRAARDLIFPATIADSVVVWPRLLEIARNRALARETRRNAIFWLGQAAGDKAMAGLVALVDETPGETDVQEQAVFALSQLRSGGGVDALLEIARAHRNPRVRKSAMFWLAQSDDPRAVKLFEDILSKQ